MENKVEMSLESFMDIMEEKADYENERDKLDEELNVLLDYLFESAELGYDNELRLYDGNQIMKYLKVKENYKYKERVEELKIKKEEEN